MALNVVSSDRLSTNVKTSNLATGLSSKVGESKNIVINGAMQVAQRGTSKTGLTNGGSSYNTLDRFWWGEAGAPSFVTTMAQSSTAPDGFANSLRLDTTTAQGSIAAADAQYIDYRIEGQDLQSLAYGTSSAKSFTLSFYVKGTITGTYAVWLYSPDTSKACTHTYTINSADTWERKTITVAGDTGSAFGNDNGLGLYVRFIVCAGTNYTSGTASTTWAAASVTDANRYVGHAVNLAATTSDDWAITGIQLEEGSTATEFEHKAYGVELTRCQRYLQVYAKVGANPEQIGPGYGYSTSQVEVQFTFNGAMRAAPSVDIGSGTNYFLFQTSGDNIQVNALTAYQFTERNGLMYKSGLSSVTQGRAYRVENNHASAYLHFNAEL
tara:strand:- start:2031 stop:3176 length:1146 start_codon:yes stop_codon:yes gene_type:complete